MHIRAICGSFRRRVWHPAIPTPPSANPPTEFTEFTEASGRGYSPTDFTEFTEVSGVGYSPTDFTDAHRFLGCVIGGVGMAGMPYPPNLCASVSICGRLSLPEGSVCSACSVGTLFLFALLVLQRQLHQRGSILPRISRISTEVRLRYWRRGYGRIPYPPNLCVSVPICGRLSLPEGSVCSAYSVGTLSPSAWLVHLRQVHPLRVPPESAPSAIGLRPPPNQIPSATQSDSVRRPIRLRSPPDRIASAARCHK